MQEIMVTEKTLYGLKIAVSDGLSKNSIAIASPGRVQIFKVVQNPTIPKYHPDLPYSMNVMLRDIRSYLARKLWKERKKCQIRQQPQEPLKRT